MPGCSGQFWGSFISTAGIFLPGTFLIFFVYRFWEQLKRYRVVRASLEGINAASTGLTAAAAIALFEPMAPHWPSVVVVVLTIVVLLYTKIPPFVLILAGLLAGIVL